MERVAHNLALTVEYSEDKQCYGQALSVLVSDVENNFVTHAEQFKVAVDPAMPPESLIHSLRALADSVESYMGEQVA